jgi:hypothetical protein
MSKLLTKPRVQKYAHLPNLKTILMIERAIKESDDAPGKVELWKSLPEQVMYSTFRAALDYLEASNKISLDKRGHLVWIAVDNKKLEDFFRHTVPLRD